MSIQSNINTALGTLEGLIMRGTKPSEEIKPKDPTTKTPETPPEASPAAPEPTPAEVPKETTSEAENAKNEPSGASESQVADIIISGNRVAGAIAAGRLAAARQARIDTARAPRDRLAEIRKISRESKAEMRGIKHQERIVRHELEKAKGGNK